jgi:hypothetical protein
MVTTVTTVTTVTKVTTVTTVTNGHNGSIVMGHDNVRFKAPRYVELLHALSLNASGNAIRDQFK